MKFGRDDWTYARLCGIDEVTDNTGLKSTIPMIDGPIRVVHVLLSMDCGGMEQVVLDLARTGLELGQAIQVICLERPGQLAPQLADLGVDLHCLDKRPGIRLKLRGKLRRLFTDFTANRGSCPSDWIFVLCRSAGT